MDTLLVGYVAFMMWFMLMDMLCSTFARMKYSAPLSFVLSAIWPFSVTMLMFSTARMVRRAKMRKAEEEGTQP